MKHHYDDLRSLYRAAARQEQPTRADKRAVRAALVGASAGAAVVTLHTSTAAGKLIALIPGGAKVLTIGQVIVYAGLGVAVGGGLTAVGVVVSPKIAAKTSTVPSPSSRKLLEKPNVQGAKPSASAESTPDLQQPAQLEPVADQKPSTNGAANGDHSLATPSGANVAERSAPAQPTVAAIPAVSGPAAAAPSIAPPTPASVRQPSLAEESRGLAAIQTALGAHDANRALALLDAQDREYGTGNLGQERAAARVLALCAAGRRAEGLAARDRFVSNYPGSPLVHRVDAACKK